MTNHTVAAVSTPFGKGGIAVIRISGDDTSKILEKVFVPAGKTVPNSAHRTAVFGNIIAADGTVVDSGIAVFFGSSCAAWRSEFAVVRIFFAVIPESGSGDPEFRIG